MDADLALRHCAANAAKFIMPLSGRIGRGGQVATECICAKRIAARGVLGAWSPRKILILQPSEIDSDALQGLFHNGLKT